MSLKIRKPNAIRMLQIQAGTKPIKALGRVIEYFKNDYDFNKDSFETFKKNYAILLSEKILDGVFCISIHPMDFMTMSDNASNWTSCMNWEESGCYHVGTIEMMNSNNVVCAYLLLGKNKFVFNKDAVDPNTGEVYGIWNNKKWRQLFYITKDIIMSGKAYPYQSKDLTLAILDQIKTLVSTNLKWEYQFGPELYQDMIHVTTMNKMENQKAWARIEKKKPFKHNIIWDTKGMYNDMLNDNDYPYWCYRNKTDSTKIISVSGKAPCLCCGQSIISETWDDDDYNNRFSNTDNAICEPCQIKYYKCSYCGRTKYSKSNSRYHLKNGTIVCEKCFSTFRICPDCGEYFPLDYDNQMTEFVYNPYLYDYLKQGKTIDKNTRFSFLYTDLLDYDKEGIDAELKIKDDNSWIKVEVLYKHKCNSYDEKKLFKFLKENSILLTYECWSTIETRYIVNPTIAEKYRAINMQRPDLESLLTTDTEHAT